MSISKWNTLNRNLYHVTKCFSHFSGSPEIVEWDLYLFHFHDTNSSFASAFFPTLDGPAVSWKSSLRQSAKESLKKYKSRRVKNAMHLKDDSISRSSSSPSAVSYLVLREDDESIREAVSKREIEDTIADSPIVAMKEISKKYLTPEYEKQIDSPFVGIREECSYVPFDRTQELPSGQKELLMFYLTLLRVHCLPDYPQRLDELFDKKLVSFKSESIPPIHLEQNNSLL